MSRIERFLANPPRRISAQVVASRKAKGSRRYPGKWLTECLKEQKNRCGYCACRMFHSGVPAEHRFRPTLDHVVPLSAGGKNARANVVAACIACNQEKGSMPADEFQAIVDGRKARWA
jgi:5-methylcytosine-specific restriction endonuclease McrA